MLESKSRQLPLPVNTCFLEEDDSSETATTAAMICWNMNAKANYAGTMCMSISQNKDAFDISYNTTGTGWFLDESHVWIGAPYTYPQGSNDESSNSSKKPLEESFPALFKPRKKKAKKDTTRHTLFSASLPFAQTGSRDKMIGQVAQCMHPSQPPSVYQMLTRSELYKNQVNSTDISDSEQITSKWAMMTTFTISCQCSDMLHTARSMTEQSPSAAGFTFKPTQSPIIQPAKSAILKHIKKPIAARPTRVSHIRKPTRTPTFRPTRAPTKPRSTRAPTTRKPAWNPATTRHIFPTRPSSGQSRFSSAWSGSLTKKPMVAPSSFSVTAETAFGNLFFAATSSSALQPTKKPTATLNRSPTKAPHKKLTALHVSSPTRRPTKKPVKVGQIVSSLRSSTVRSSYQPFPTYHRLPEKVPPKHQRESLGRTDQPKSQSR
jgi:hypothetical protein